MALPKCPHMAARCPHKVPDCDDPASKQCHYIGATTSAALMLYRSTEFGFSPDDQDQLDRAREILGSVGVLRND